MFTLQRKIGVSINKFSNIESCKNPDVESILTKEQEGLAKFEKEEKKNNGSLLSAFGRMANSLIDGKNLLWDQKSKAEEWKKNLLADASTILNDSTLNAEGKRNALQNLFWTFKENTEYFPKVSSENTNQKNEEKENPEKFTQELLKVISENRVASQESNANFAKDIRDKTACPAHGGWNPPENPATGWPA